MNEKRKNLLEAGPFHFENFLRLVYALVGSTKSARRSVAIDKVRGNIVLRVCGRLPHCPKPLWVDFFCIAGGSARSCGLPSSVYTDRNLWSKTMFTGLSFT